MGVLKIIAVAYKRPAELKLLISSLVCQSSPNWELYIIHDGPAPEDVTNVVLDFQDERIMLCESKERKGNYGHPNRRMMLQKIKADQDDFILLTNDDNFYVKNFVKTMMTNATKTVGLIHCDMLHNYTNYNILKTEPKNNKIDMGAFIVRADIAKAVGFNSTKFDADGIYCEECAEYCRKNNYRILHIDKIMFVHN